MLCLHGLGGTPHSVLPLTAAAHGAGYATVAPMLPGHGSTPADLYGITWSDWVAAVTGFADDLARRCHGIVIVGQSMGATLALQVAASHSHVRGVAAINPLVLPPDPDATEQLEYLLGRGRTMQPAGAPDIRDGTAHDTAYSELPLHSLLQLGIGSATVHELMPALRIPLLIVSSDHDAVVDPANADALGAVAVGPVTRLRLANSGHVAALDLDREQLCRELLTWLVTLTDESAVSV